MTIDEAINLLRVNYAKATNREYIRSPLAYALHKTWKAVDSGETEYKRPHGHWSEGMLGKCSVCGHIGNPKWKVCVCCGAIMDEVVK